MSEPEASTSTSTYQTRSKRKSDVVSVLEPAAHSGGGEEGGELELAEDDGNGTDGYADGEDEDHADKKAETSKGKGKAKPRKKKLTKKVAVWSDLREWRAGDDPLGRFPVEVLDL